MHNPEETCKDCENRYPGCHDRCEHHAKRKQKWAEERELERKKRASKPRGKFYYKSTEGYWRTK